MGLLLGVLLATAACADDSNNPGDETHKLGPCDPSFMADPSARCEAACTPAVISAMSMADISPCDAMAGRDLAVGSASPMRDFRCNSSTTTIDGVRGCCEIMNVHEDPQPAAAITEVVFLVCN